MFASAFKGADGPTPNAETQFFWDEAKAGRFVLPRCKACGKTHWYPRAFCPFCHSNVEWVGATGRGTVYSYTVTGKDEARYCLAYVQLEEGPRVLTNVLVEEAASLKVGASVRVGFHVTGETAVPVFRLTSEMNPDGKGLQP